MQETPLCNMSYYLYSMLVVKEDGDPENLTEHQYAFEPHYCKYHDCVQRLRRAPEAHLRLSPARLT